MSERRDIRAKIREYEKDGEKKAYFQTIGSAWIDGDQISINLDVVPLNWDGKAFLNKPLEKKPDVLPDDEELEKPIDLSQIPF